MTLKELLIKREELEKKLREVAEATTLPIEAEIQGLSEQIGNQATELVKAVQDKDTGTFTTTDDGVIVKASVGKTVKWDQGKLAAIYNKIKESGDDPAQYIKAEYSVPENYYKGWPEQVKTVFLPARTVIPKKPTFTFEIIPF